MRHGTHHQQRTPLTTTHPPEGPGSRPAEGERTDDRALDALLAEIVPTRAVGTAADLFRDLARELSVNVTMWTTLLAGHTASADGRYCTHRQCRRGGCGTLATPHPCSVRTLALIARTLHRTGEGPPVLAGSLRSAQTP